VSLEKDIAVLRDAASEGAVRVAAAERIGAEGTEHAARALLDAGSDDSLPDDVARAVGIAMARVEGGCRRYTELDFAEVRRAVYDAFCEA
jgi:hypothetical protein